MKQLYLLLFAFLPYFVFSQSISQSDLPAVGTSSIMANDSNYVAAIPAGGAGQTWNYSGLINLYQDTSLFGDASGTPYYPTFGTSNLSGHNMADDSYTYFTTDATGFYADGLAGPGGNFVFSPKQMIVPVPFSYGSNTSNTSRLQVDSLVYIAQLGGNYNVRFKSTVEETFDGDGTGSLTTPTGTYSSVLRIKQSTIDYDSIFVDLLGLGSYSFYTRIVSYSYKYHFATSGTQHNYLLVIEADSAGTTSTTSSYFLANLPSGVQELTKESVYQVYPNPASHSIFIKNINDNPQINIYDANGKKVKTAHIGYFDPVNIESLSEGIYYYDIPLNNRVEKGTFTVIK